MMLIGDILSMSAYRFPDRVALIAQKTRLTYRELEENANRMARVLLDLGIKSGDRVGLIEKTCISGIEMALAVIKTGAIMVNINNLLGHEELIRVIKDCDPAVLIFGDEYEALIRGVREDAPGIRHYLSVETCEWTNSLRKEALTKPVERPDIHMNDCDAFMILYTAGTTGEPKGAVYTHRAFWENLLTTVIDTYKQTYNDIWIGPVPMYHIGGFGTLMRVFLMANTFVLKSKFDPMDYLLAIENEKVTILYAYPTMINAMIQTPGAEQRDLSSLRLVIYGGSPIPESTLETAYRLFQCDFLQRYGATECCGSAILILSPEMHRLALSGDDTGRKILQSAGKPCLGVRVKLVDRNNEEIIDSNKPGILLAQLEAPMKEYWRASEKTAEAFRDGWLCLEDIAKFDEDGFFYLVDRAKDMIVSGARNIYPREVEEVLYAHPAVREACVIGVPDDYWGEAVKAVVVLKPDIEATEQELIEYCRQRLASYKKPKSVDFVAALPKNAGGKIIKNEVKQKYWHGRDRRIH